MKPKIVLITDSRDPSGLGIHMLALARGLSERYDTIIACQDDPAGMQFLKQAAREGRRVKAFDLHDMPKLKSWLSSSNAELLHVHAGIGWEGHGLVRAGKAAGLAVVRTEHLPYLLTSVVQQAEYRAMLLSVDRRIAVSQAVFHSHRGQGGAHLAVIPNGIWSDTLVESSGAIRDGLGLAATDKIVLTVARFTPQKGHGALLDAMPAILESQPHARFVWAGDGPERPALEHKIAQLGLEKHVHLLGNRNDIAMLLSAADLFVLPSHFEGLSLALLEAMAAGVPIVTTRIGGTLEAIGVDHPFLVQPNDPDALATGIVQALSDDVVAGQAAEKARARFGASFTAIRMAAQTADIYAELISSSRTQSR